MLKGFDKKTSKMDLRQINQKLTKIIDMKACANKRMNYILKLWSGDSFIYKEDI